MIGMNTSQIVNAKTRAEIPFNAALQIRTILEEVRKDYGAKRYDEDEVESQILALVTDEEE